MLMYGPLPVRCETLLEAAQVHSVGMTMAFMASGGSKRAGCLQWHVANRP